MVSELRAWLTKHNPANTDSRPHLATAQHLVAGETPESGEQSINSHQYYGCLEVVMKQFVIRGATQSLTISS